MDKFIIIGSVLLFAVVMSLTVFFAYKKVLRDKKSYASGRAQNGDVYFDHVCSKYLKLTNVE